MAKIRPAIICFVILFGFVFPPAAAMGAPKADLWPRWQKNNPDSPTVIDHGTWDSLLKRYVATDHPSGIYRFQYRRVTEADRLALEAYLEGLQAVEVSGLSRQEQKAFWINLYNALTVNVVLQHYPVKSIRDIDISPGIFANGPWDAKLARVEGVQLTLNDIEHRILRPIWRDNRVHYGVNCASLGCPNLIPEAFTAANLEAQLEKTARDYVNHPRGVSFPDRRILVSSIYFWFREDFGDSENGLVEHLQKYLSEANRRKLEKQPRKFSHAYDWSLNE